MRRGGYGYFSKNQIKQRQSSARPTESGIYTTVVESCTANVQQKLSQNILINNSFDKI